MILGTKSKLQRKKTEPAEFAADNIDSTASTKEILESLHDQNNAAFTFFCQNIRPRPNTIDPYMFHFTLTGHPLHAFPEDWDGDLNSGYFKSFMYKSLMPKMIASIRNMDLGDPVTELLKTKHDWRHDRNQLRLTAVKSNMLDRYIKCNEEVVQCPKHIVDIAAHLDNDPDPYFDDSYNWYYAGHGNMQLMCIDSDDYMLHSEFSNCSLTKFSKTELRLTTEPSATFNCESNNILETICSTQNIVALRTKHKVYILKVISTNDKIEFDKLEAMESEMPFTSISFDNYHKNILYITNLDSKLIIVNLDRMTGKTVKLRTKAKTLVNNWSAVISSDRMTYTHVARKSIGIYDKRTNKTDCFWYKFRDFTDHTGCNDITVAWQNLNNFSLYFGTDHHLFLLDMRYQKQLKPKPLMRWTHGMQCIPTYMSICDFEYNHKLISLSSQWCEDMCVVPDYTVNFGRGKEKTSVTLPYRPPSILNTLNEAKEKLLCLDIYDSIDDRVCTCITGHKIIEHNQNYVVLMQSSLGDISSHVLYPEHMESFIVDDSLKQLYKWSKGYKSKIKPFAISHLKDISQLWKELKLVPDNYRFGGSSRGNQETKDMEQEIHDIFENEELDEGLLDIWTKENTSTNDVKQESLVINMHYSSHDDSEQ